jgi:endonuclease YncB( thermonuclease family)
MLALLRRPKAIAGALVCLTALSSSSLAAETLAGRVVAIADGDTLTILDSSNEQHRIRLSGIDAPEKKQPFGSRAKQNLSSLAFGKDALVEWSKLDRYERIVGKVTVNNCRRALPGGITSTPGSRIRRIR